jgi:hypothetical protein
MTGSYRSENQVLNKTGRQMPEKNLMLPVYTMAIQGQHPMSKLRHFLVAKFPASDVRCSAQKQLTPALSRDVAWIARRLNSDSHLNLVELGELRANGKGLVRSSRR